MKNKQVFKFNPEDSIFSHLHIIKSSDIIRTSKLFSRAFLNNPMYKILLPNLKKRIKNLHYIFEYNIRYAIKHGFIYSYSEKIESAAVWIPSFYVKETFIDQIRAGGLKVLFRCGLGFLKRKNILMEITNLCHLEAEKQMPKGHIYLSPICVDPEFQGKGYATRLFKPMIAYSHKYNIPLYLETAKEENLSLYHYFGFEEIVSMPIPYSNFVNHGMAYFPSKKKKYKKTKM